MKKTAILVDGGFFIKRYRAIYKPQNLDPEKVADDLWRMCLNHLEQAKGEIFDLYRIYFYDCRPFAKKQHNPLSGRLVDFAKSEQFRFRNQLFEELKKKRKVALRLGVLGDNQGWVIRKSKVRDLLNKKITIEDLKEDDIHYSLTQKQVDTKIGLDIAAITLKKQVDQIILISGDSDFVPAAKLARREGIDVVLDPMWNPIQPHLFEHIDGLISHCKRPAAFLRAS